MPDYINQNLTAYHYDRDAVREKNFNENNPGIGYESDDGIHRVMLGGYKNSERRNSLYALAGYTPFRLGDLQAGIVGGGVTGYRRDITPVLGLLMSKKLGDLGVNLVLSPNVPKQNVYGFAGLQLRYPLK